MIDSILSGGDPVSPEPIPLARLVFGVPRRTFLLEDLDDVVARAFERALSKVSAAGARIIEVDFPDMTIATTGFAPRSSIVPSEAYALLRDHLAERQGQCDRRALANILAGKEIKAADYYDMLGRRRALIQAMERSLAGLDGWLAPTCAAIASPLASVENDEAEYFKVQMRLARNTAPVNMLDGCALSLPCHEPGEGPVGLMLAGVAGADAHVLAAGLAVEAVLAA
jgi:aspartyl-tRNA(Asn)/glutamyl-tRNA(Gln) amidotransferase subunit A